MTRSKGLVLLGGGGHCRSVIDVLEQAGLAIAGVVHGDACEALPAFEYPVLGHDRDLPRLREMYHNALVTIGQIQSPRVRKILYARLVELGFSLPTVLSPQACVAARAHIASGSVVMHRAMVNSGASVGHNCIINTKALVEHDCVIEDHCHVAVGAILCGGVRLGEGSFVGAGAIIREGVQIGANCVVGMGCRVRHHLAEGSRYAE